MGEMRADDDATDDGGNADDGNADDGNADDATTDDATTDDATTDDTTADDGGNGDDATADDGGNADDATDDGGNADDGNADDATDDTTDDGGNADDATADDATADDATTDDATTDDATTDDATTDDTNDDDMLYDDYTPEPTQYYNATIHTANNWVLVANVTGSKSQDFDQFGYAVAFCPYIGKFYVGAPENMRSKYGAENGRGSVYTFNINVPQNGGISAITVKQSQKYSGITTSKGSGFGSSITQCVNNVVAVGAITENNNHGSVRILSINNEEDIGAGTKIAIAISLCIAAVFFVAAAFIWYRTRRGATAEDGEDRSLLKTSSSNPFTRENRNLGRHEEDNLRILEHGGEGL